MAKRGLNRELGRQKKPNAVYIFGGIILAIVVIVALFIYSEKRTTTVTTDGSAQMKVQPDIVVVYIQAQSIDKTAQGASAVNDKIVEDLTLSLLRLGFSKEEIQTEQFSIYPNYDYEKGKQELTGYTASQNIKIETADLKKVSAIVDSAASAGALISYINFELTLDNQNMYKAQLLEKATQDARIKAESIARGLGKGVKGVVSVSTNTYDYYPFPLFKAEDSSVGGAGGVAQAREAAASITPRQLEINAAVSVTFRI